MNADKVNQWLSLAANLGVLAGIGLLVFELNQNRDLARAQIHQARSDAWVDSRFERADSEFVAPALLKLYEAGYPDNPQAMDALSPLEVRRMRDIFAGFAGDYDNLIYQYQHGYLDEEYYVHRIEPSIQEMAHHWQTLGTLKDMPYLQQAIEQLAENEQ